MTLDRNRVVAVVVGLVVAGAVFALWPRAEDDPETLIQRKVIQMSRAAEKKDLGFITEQISENFQGGGGFRKPELKGFLAGQVLRGNWVRVFVENTRVSVQGDQAEFQGKFIFGRSEAKSVSELARDSVMGSYRIDAKLTREQDGEWRFVSATWREESVL